MINISLTDKIIEQKDVFKTNPEMDVIPFTVMNTAKIPALEEKVSCWDTKKAIEHLGLVLLHKLYRDEISLGDILGVVEFNVNDVIAKIKSHISGKVRPGVTKNGFGPIHAAEIFEKMTKKKDDLESMRALFIIASVSPFMTVVGSDYFVLQSEYEEVEISDDKLNDVIRASRMLECFFACVGMCEEKKRQVNKNDFFSIENWVIFLRTLKNVLNIEADKVELFESSIEHVSVLLAASKLNIVSKDMILFSDALASAEANALKENYQIINRGIANISALPTILAKNITIDKLKFDLANVFSAFNGEIFVKNTPFKLTGGVINCYTDTDLKGSVRGSMIIGTHYVERPIQVIKKLEESSVYYSYSTDGFSGMGKVITESANSLYNVMLDSVFKSITDVKYYAVKGHHSNLEESELRKLLYITSPNSVFVYVPVSVKDAASGHLLTDELNKIKFLYKMASVKDFLEYESVTGFKVLGSILLEHPYLPLLKALNPAYDKSVVLAGERRKAYIKALSYDMCLLRDVKTFNLDYANSVINFSETVDSVSVSFNYNSREILRLSTAGNYYLDSPNYSLMMTKLNNIKKDVLRICKQSYVEIYKKVDNEEKFEVERRFELARQVIKDNVTLKDIARRVRHTVMQSLIDDTGAYREDVTMSQINELMNKAFFKILEHLAKEILGRAFEIEDEIKDNPKIKREYIGGHYEDFVQ